MKKLFLLAILIGWLQGVNAQMTTGGKGSDCATYAMNELTSCLSSNNILYDMTTDESGIVFIVTQGNPPPGQIQSCIAQYNQFRADCSDLPIVVNNSSSGNQIEKTPH
ncbi:MAG: hypothetical protein A3F72_02650 [Bacteroidetes bacterium RIFCSPLOWO2_12_FULL_35_15]|nr:MAG: hypothetical protein A3F72_02650 [Bacteroidetes bacterium RIFCSPLOWO2_12_FULL_35_15]